MKIIEAMKAVKANKEKITDLSKRIAQSSANLSNETPLYGDDTATKITGWLQSIHDTGAENVRLLTAIARTNMNTSVTITLGGVNISKTIAEWVWRRREYADLDRMAWQTLSDRQLRETRQVNSQGQAVDIKIVRHFDPAVRDNKIDLYRQEPHLIDAALEVVNATTDLIEQ
jgi:hypothetical protein